MQLAGLVLLLAGFSGILRPSGGAQITAIYELKSGDAGQVAITLDRIVREQGPSGTLARRSDGRGWWISVYHRDVDVANEQMNRIRKGVASLLDESVGGIVETRSVNAAVFGAWGRIRPGFLLAGVWTGLVGALLLTSAQPGRFASRSGKVALGFFMAALAGSGGIFSFAPMEWRHQALIFGAVALLVALACGLAGRHSRQGRIALAGVWVVFFLWTVSVGWNFVGLPHPHPPGFEVVALGRGAFGDSPDPSARLAESPSNISSEVREQFNDLIRDLAIHEVRHGESHPTTRERRAKLEAFLNEHPGLPDDEMCLGAPLQHTAALKEKREHELSGMGPKHPKSVMIDAQLKAAEITLSLCESRRREAEEEINVEKP